MDICYKITLSILVIAVLLLLPAPPITAENNKSPLSQRQKDGFNIYYLGGSSIKGEPFEPELSVPQLVEYIFQKKINGRQIHSYNFGDYGKNSHDVYIHLKEVINDTNNSIPSLAVIYSGHNEFLRYHGNWGFSIGKYSNSFLDRLAARFKIVNRIFKVFKKHRLEIEERSFFDEPIISIGEYDKVIENYKTNILEIISLLQSRNIPLIICTVAGNYADWQPNRSVFMGNEDEINKFRKLIRKGIKNQEKGFLKEAVDNFQSALDIDPTFAEIHYRLGKIYEKQKNYKKAWTEYEKAVNFDRMPIRALSEQNRFIQNLNKLDGVFVVDVVQALRERDQNGLIGYNLMSDGHHPNLESYIAISKEISQKILQIFSKNDHYFMDWDLDKIKKQFGIDDNKMYAVYASRMRWLIRIATWRYDMEDRLLKAEEYFNQAQKLRPRPESNSLYFELAIISLLRKDIVNAELFMKKASEIDIDSVRNRLNNHWIKDIVYRANATKMLKKLKLID